MLLSMTGFGRSKGEYEGRTYTIDIKALNGKTTDLRAKLPTYLKAKEIDLRKHLMDRMKRGKMDFIINLSAGEESLDFGLNMNLVEKYYSDLSAFAKRVGLSDQDFLQTIIRIPNVIETKEDEIPDEEYAFVRRLVDDAVDQLMDFRAKEGAALKDDLTSRAKAILNLLEKVGGYEADRKKELLERLRRLLDEHLANDAIDENRLEQETIHYLEKLDIHEEKIRLEQHCRYFLGEIDSEAGQLGKKLNFIAQEMGREINTLGAKAQYSSIQQLVVEMKVELDQIREQLANVL